MEQLKVFENPEFGQVRTEEVDGKLYFCGSDVASALGYKRTADAISAHCRWSVKHRVPHPQSPEKQIEMYFIPEGDVYRLIVHSNLPSAEKFEKWLFDEVVPSIRKTGSYSLATTEVTTALATMTEGYNELKKEVLDMKEKMTQVPPEEVMLPLVHALAKSMRDFNLVKLIPSKKVKVKVDPEQVEVIRKAIYKRASKIFYENVNLVYKEIEKDEWTAEHSGVSPRKGICYIEYLIEKRIKDLFNWVGTESFQLEDIRFEEFENVIAVCNTFEPDEKSMELFPVRSIGPKKKLTSYV